MSKAKKPQSRSAGSLLRLPQVAAAKIFPGPLVPPLGNSRIGHTRLSLQETCAALLPGWLSSLVVHLTLAILLGVLAVKIPARPGQLVLGFEAGGGSGQGGMTNNLELDRALAAGGDVARVEFDQVPLPSIHSEVEAKLSVEVVEFETPRDATRGQLTEAVLHSTQEIRAAGARSGYGGGMGEGVGGAGVGTGFGTAPTRTQVFGVAEEARSFVYVFDHSDSMISVLSYSSEGKTVFSITPLEAAKAELLRSLDDLGAGQGFQIVFYNHVFHVFEDQGASTHLLPATAENKSRAAAFVKNAYGEGSTNHMPALEAALSLRPEAIFLLTDGEAKDDPSPSDLAYIRNLNRGRTKINVIHFCFAHRPESTLVQLAQENRGRHLSFSLSRLGPGMHGAAARRGSPAGAAPENAVSDPQLRAP